MNKLTTRDIITLAASYWVSHGIKARELSSRVEPEADPFMAGFMLGFSVAFKSVQEGLSKVHDTMRDEAAETIR